jgi:hypothetical protein
MSYLNFDIESQSRSSDHLLWRATMIGSRDLCYVAKSQGATNYNDMLNLSAVQGNKELCLLAKEWGATDFNGMLKWARKNKHIDLCLLAKQWGASSLSWSDFLYPFKKLFM